jgi:hypothetical protein
MGNHPRKDVDDDILAWAIIGLIFAALTLFLWGALFWQSIRG